MSKIIIDVQSNIFKWEAKYNKRMTYKRLSEAAGISLAALNRMKSGKAKRISLSNLEKVCKALECQPGDIVKRVSE